jgi:hypothetical protein
MRTSEEIKHIKKAYQLLYGSARKAERVTFHRFFNTLKNNMLESQMRDDTIRRIEQTWSANNYALLRKWFRDLDSDQDVLHEMMKSLEPYRLGSEQLYSIANKDTIEKMRAIANARLIRADDSSIRDFIYKLLVERGNVKGEVADTILDQESIQIMREAFTSNIVDPVKNYEIWETLGDGIAKGFLRFYSVRRLPYLRTSERASEVLTDIGKNFENKSNFSLLFDRLGMRSIATYRYELIWIDETRRKDLGNREYIIATLVKSMKEDMFESLFGALQWIIDSKLQLGLGNAICYNIFSSIWDEGELDDSKDPITLLKEIFDNLKTEYYYIGQANKHVEYQTHEYKTQEKDIEKGKGEHQGLLRLKLLLIFFRDQGSSQKGDGLSWKLKQDQVVTLWSDWSLDLSAAKHNVAEKGVRWFKEEKGIVWKKKEDKQ